VPLFLISLKAGGTGLNLTAADTVIHYDPWWNPAVEEQATARAHRIGQDKPVFVYKLMTQGTVEEKILALQDRKRGLADQLLKQGGARRGRRPPADRQRPRRAVPAAGLKFAAYQGLSSALAAIQRKRGPRSPLAQSVACRCGVSLRT
jgi:hypothetical protein